MRWWLAVDRDRSEIRLWRLVITTSGAAGQHEVDAFNLGLAAGAAGYQPMPKPRHLHSV